MRTAAFSDVARPASSAASVQIPSRSNAQIANSKGDTKRERRATFEPRNSQVVTRAPRAPLYSRPPGPGLFNLRSKFRKRVSRSTNSASRFSDARLQRWIDPGFASTSQRLKWDDELEKDIVAVAKEAGLTSKTIKSVLLAVKDGDLPCNPGVLLPQVLHCTNVMEKYTSRKHVQRLVQKLPALLNHCPEAMSTTLTVLAPLFSQPGQLQTMLYMHPKLLLASPFIVWSNLDELSKILQVDVEELMPLVTKHPRLLNSDPSDLNLRFRKLGELTQLSHHRLVKLIIRQPALLSYFHYTLADNVQNIASVLDVPLWRATSLVVRQPSVAMLRPDSLEAKVVSLEAILNCGMMRVSFMILKQPSLLTLSTENLERKFQRMAGILGVTQEAATSMIVAMPALLTVTPELLQSKVSGLKSVASLRPSWQAQLVSATPKTLAYWVCFSSKRYLRFQEACENSLEDLSMAKILKASDKEWRALVSS